MCQNRLCNSVALGVEHQPAVEVIEAEQKRGKTTRFFGSPAQKQNQARTGWPKCLGLVQATPRADFAVITVQL